MFRKDTTAVEEWSVKQISLCAERQKMILECADQMLTPGGVMVYSTCTFSPEEDERMVAWFLSAHPDYVLEDWRDILPTDCGLENGKPETLPADNAFAQSAEIEKSLRLWPHKLKGEGHFAARLRKGGISPTLAVSGKSKKKKQADLDGYLDFAKQFLHTASAKDTSGAAYSVLKQLAGGGEYQYFGDALYHIPPQMNTLRGLKVIRAGLHLGTRKKNRFEPAHAFAMSLSPSDVTQYTDCNYDTALRYLRGETIPCDSSLRSWTLVCCDGISLGWGKAQNGILKNHYPKGLRRY
jgi:NOL1/NOP2/fmu family ribosome biogenesis protein